MWDMHWSNDLAHFSEVSRYYRCAVGLIQFLGLPDWITSSADSNCLDQTTCIQLSHYLGMGKHFANILHLKGRTVKFIDVEGEGGVGEGGKFSLGVYVSR